MKRFDALVSMSILLLRSRGEWQRSTTSHAEIDLAVNQCSDLIGDGTREQCEAAISELKRRVGFGEAA